MFNRDSLAVRMNLFAKWKYFCEFRDGNINTNVLHYGKNNYTHLTSYNRIHVTETYIFSLQDKNTHAPPLVLPTEILAHIFFISIVNHSL